MPEGQPQIPPLSSPYRLPQVEKQPVEQVGLSAREG